MKPHPSPKNWKRAQKEAKDILSILSLVIYSAALHKHIQCFLQSLELTFKGFKQNIFSSLVSFKQIQNKRMVSPNLRQFTLASSAPTERVLQFIYLSFPYLVLILNKEETMLDGKLMSKDVWIKEFVLSTHFPFAVAKKKKSFPFVVKVIVPYI